MNQAELKRSKELSRAIVALSNGIKAKEKVDKKKDLDFLNNLTGLNIPKVRKLEVKSAPNVKKNLDYLQKRTGLPIPKKEVPKQKDLKFVDRLGGISHSEITQDALVDKLFQKAQAQLNTIKSDLFAELGVLRAEAITRETNNLIISDELMQEFLYKLKNLPENQKLDVTHIRNYQSFIYKGHRYGIEELMHGGGGGNNGIEGLNTLVDGVVEGLLDTINFVAGDNMVLTYSIVGGVPTITFSSTGTSPTTALAVSDLSSQANGSNTVFTIPTNTSVVALIGSDAPFIYRPIVDYTVSGTTLTFTGAVSPPSSGATLLLEYTPSGITVAVSDLSSLTDGVTTVFTVPASFSTLSLRGSDFPFMYRPTTDFTVVGTTLTILTTAPSLGSTLMFEYTVSSPSATTTDLTSQCNGVNMVFTIPAITTAISLTGTDFPVVYRQGVDYVISGTTLTLVSVPAPTGTLLLSYV